MKESTIMMFLSIDELILVMENRIKERLSHCYKGLIAYEELEDLKTIVENEFLDDLIQAGLECELILDEEHQYSQYGTLRINVKESL